MREMSFLLLFNMIALIPKHLAIKLLTTTYYYTQKVGIAPEDLMVLILLIFKFR